MIQQSINQNVSSPCPEFPLPDICTVLQGLDSDLIIIDSDGKLIRFSKTRNRKQARKLLKAQSQSIRSATAYWDFTYACNPLETLYRIDSDHCFSSGLSRFDAERCVRRRRVPTSCPALAQGLQEPYAVAPGLIRCRALAPPPGGVSPKRTSTWEVRF